MSGGRVQWATTHGDTVTVYRQQQWIEIDEDKNEWRPVNLWRYRVQAGNNEIVEVSSEGYTRRTTAVTAARRHHPEVAQ